MTTKKNNYKFDWVGQMSTKPRGCCNQPSDIFQQNSTLNEVNNTMYPVFIELFFYSLAGLTTMISS